MSTKLIAMVAASAVCASGCSFLFQSTLPSHHQTNAEPTCSSGSGTAVVDTIFAILDGAGAIAGASDTSGVTGDQELGAILGAALFATSALYGYSEANKCEAAIADYKKAVAAKAVDARDESIRRLEAERPVAPTPPALPPQPRGWYCTSSPTVETADMCMREKDACGQAREAALGAVADLTDCALVEHAYCVATTANRAKCAATLERCNVMRERIVAAGVEVPACEER